MTPQELKNSILQLAIQGKLVEHRPEEGTAEELYRQIQGEKRRLIKEGKIKKEKPLPEITEDEVPFEIPDNWKWVRLVDITWLNPKNKLEDNLKVSFVPMPLISDGFQNSHTFEVRQWGEIKKGFTHFSNGDIGIAKITPCFQNRKSVIFTELENGYGAGTTELSIVRVIGNLLSRKYLLYFFKSAYFIGNGVKSFTGTAGQQRINRDYLPMCLIPLPPLAEQKRIVAKIEELLPYIDRYEQAWNRLEEFNKRFPVDLQKSILQMAIQGGLVEHRPEEGTAEELYQQIQAEKRRLIKEGKIKKEKSLPEIAEDEKPFDIPDSWKWVRLQQIGELSRGRSQRRPRNDPSLFTDGTFPFIQTGDVARANGHITNWLTMYNEAGVSQSRIWPRGTVCLTIAANIGDVAILDFDACFPDSVVGFNAYKPVVSNEFFMYGLMCYKNILDRMSRSTAQKNINIEILSQIAFPLPPLAEQKRIVAKLEELLPLCERLK